MDPYASEEEQLEKIRNWWKENGAFIVSGVLLGLAILFGWRWWGDYRDESLAFASERFEQVQDAAERDDLARMIELAGEIEALRVPNPYADLAALAIAGEAAGSGAYDEAKRQLRKVMESGHEHSIRTLARLRLARLVLAEQDLEGAEALLEVEQPGRYAPLFHELRGDLAAARGDRERAISEYRRALADDTDGIADRAMLQMKLDDLGAGRAGSEA